MRTLPPGLAAHLAGGVTTLARCWQVTRGDGLVLGFTDHDRDLVFDGVTHRAASGLSASAAEDQLGLAAAGLELEGALTGEALGEADLAAGRFDGAALRLFLVNWQDVAQRVLLRTGTIGEVRRGRLGFTAECLGLAQAIDRSTGRLFTARCGHVLGDGRCRVDLGLPAHHGSGTITLVRGRLQVEGGGLDGFAAGIFSGGRLAWTGGANQGQAVELAGHAVAAGRVVLSLAQPMAFPLAPGDGFTVAAGCDKSFATCRDRFANGANFGGFPHMPGNDFVLAAVDRAAVNDGGRR